jgi:hypothetical protein
LAESIGSKKGKKARYAHNTGNISSEMDEKTRPHLIRYGLDLSADGFFPGELAVIQIGIKTVLAEKLFMAAFFNNISVFHHKNQVGIEW